MLTLIGTGLCDALDITLRGKQAIDAADAVYIESYTSLLQCTHEELEEVLCRPVKKLSRTAVEQEIEPILEQAKTGDVALLVIGDPFGATTHADLLLRARAMEVPVRVIHNATILSAVGEIGLELYRFGKTVSIPYWEQGFEPTSFVQGIQDNKSRGLHTLCLLDIKADEGRFMNVQEGVEHLRKAGMHNIPLLVGIARLGCPDQVIVAGSPDEVCAQDFGKPPHCIILPGKLHPIEEELLR